jgi:deoxyribose-phosphate aldolase
MEQNWNVETLAGVIDHTLLKAFVTPKQVSTLCDEAKKYNFASVCVNPVFVSQVARELMGGGVKTCCVIGFPLGASSPLNKAEEAKLAVQQGADEVDMVINIGYLKSGDAAFVEQDIRGVVETAEGAVVKVIIETCYLEDDEKRKACEISVQAGAHFVKTSTGFGTGGATVEDIRLMRATVGDACQIKASGGIRSLDDALGMLEAGADRLGVSAGVEIVEELRRRTGTA